MHDDLQFDSHGRLRHLLTIEGLPRQTVLDILNTAESFISVGEREIKKVPLLRGKTVVNLFFEASTRTRTTFEIAAKRLSADVINLNPSAASTSKGETLLDTVRNLEAMHTELFVVRHRESGAAHLIARRVPAVRPFTMRRTIAPLNPIELASLMPFSLTTMDRSLLDSTTGGSSPRRMVTAGLRPRSASP